MKKSFFLFVVLVSVIFSGVAEAGKDALPGILSLLLGASHCSGAPQSNQALIVGPLSGNVVIAYRVSSLDTPLEGPKNAVSSNNLDSAGTFDLALAGAADTDLIVVAATGGNDIDYNGDGTVDSVPTANHGTLHALASAKDWRTRHLRISPLTELAWRYIENLTPEVAEAELAIRMADLAGHLIKTDIDGNGQIDWYDILAFNPADASHRSKLKFDYTWLAAANDAGDTILASLLAGDVKKAQLLAQLDETFSYLMTRYPAPDSRYHSIKITLSVFGPGSATSGAPYNLAVDSTAATPVYEDHEFITASDTDVTFTATAASGARILGWTGCETVSADLSQCTVDAGASQSVVANFGRIATELKGVVHDLSRSSNTVEVGTISVVIPGDMTDLIADMSTAVVGDFVVGDDGGGFLCRITAITKNSPTSYQLSTEDANLDEVIASGTWHLGKQMTNGDLEGYTEAVAGPTSTGSVKTFSGPPGVQLKAAKNPADRTFTIVIGAPNTKTIPVQEKSTTVIPEVVLYDDGHGGTIKGSGELSLDIALDYGADYSFPFDLRAAKLITILNAEQQVKLTVSAKLAKFAQKKIYIGTIPFAPICTMIGPVPVWITPSVAIYLFADGSIELTASFGSTFKQHMEGGLRYNKDTGIDIHKRFWSDQNYTLSAEINASIKGGLIVSQSLKIYNAVGPAIPIESYLKLSASAAAEVVEGCADVIVRYLAGVGASFQWDLSGSTKFGKMLHLDKIEDKTRFEIGSIEFPLKTWTPYDSCEIQGPFLVVKGESLFTTIELGDTNGLATTFTVSNTGNETLHWATSNVPAPVTLWPVSGDLAPGAETIVQVSVATEALPVGHFLKQIFFYNTASVNTNLPDSQFGNTYKTIDITVQKPIIDTPSLTSATSANVGQVSLNWSFTPSGTEPFTAFHIYATQTPQNADSWRLVAVRDIYQFQAVLSDYSPGSTYSFALRAYSNNNTDPGPWSNVLSVLIAGNPPVGTVTSAGQVWMDRNLGASQVATSSTDSAAYGDLYQWGRGADGHQLRTSPTTATTSATDAPGHGSFITTNSYPADWRAPQNNSLWQGVSGTNNPCPSGFRLPTETELDTERASWVSNDSAGAYASPLKLVMAGSRFLGDGSLYYSAGSGGYFWSSTVGGSNARYLYFYSGFAYVSSGSRANGLSLRCLKD